MIQESVMKGRLDVLVDSTVLLLHNACSPSTFYRYAIRTPRQAQTPKLAFTAWFGKVSFVGSCSYETGNRMTLWCF